MYQLGLKKNTWHFSNTFKKYDDPIEVSNKYVNMANKIIDTHLQDNFNSVQIRITDKNDYFNTFYTHNATSVELHEILKEIPNKFPIFVLSTKCSHKILSVLTLLDYTIVCSSSFFKNLHPFENLLISKLVATKSSLYLGLELSTITQNILQWRNSPPPWLKVNKIRENLCCSIMWCKRTEHTSC